MTCIIKAIFFTHFFQRCLKLNYSLTAAVEGLEYYVHKTTLSWLRLYPGLMHCFYTNELRFRIYTLDL